MQPRPTKLTIKVKGKVHEITTSTLRAHKESTEKDPIALNEPNLPSKIETNQNTPNIPHKNDTKETNQNPVQISSSENSLENESAPPSYDNSKNQLVLYDPIEAASNLNPVACQPQSFPRHLSDNQKAVPVIGAFTVQCAKCFKWRLIPAQEIYEKIREHISVQPFFCETAREWHPDVSCDDPTDIEQDGTRLWAIDKPDIAQPPPGWKRLLRIRSEGSSKFADVYYIAPDGSKHRSMPDVERFLENFPRYAEGVSIRQFSFQIPKPLKENYVRKRSHMPAPGTPGSGFAAEPIAWAGPDADSHVQIVEPIAWAGPEDDTDGAPGLAAPSTMTPDHGQLNRAWKKPKTAP